MVSPDAPELLDTVRLALREGSGSLTLMATGYSSVLNSPSSIQLKLKITEPPSSLSWTLNFEIL